MSARPPPLLAEDPVIEPTPMRKPGSVPSVQSPTSRSSFVSATGSSSDDARGSRTEKRPERSSFASASSEMRPERGGSFVSVASLELGTERRVDRGSFASVESATDDFARSRVRSTERQEHRASWSSSEGGLRQKTVMQLVPKSMLTSQHMQRREVSEDLKQIEHELRLIGAAEREIRYAGMAASSEVGISPMKPTRTQFVTRASLIPASVLEDAEIANLPTVIPDEYIDEMLHSTRKTRALTAVTEEAHDLADDEY